MTRLCTGCVSTSGMRVPARTVTTFCCAGGEGRSLCGSCGNKGMAASEITLSKTAPANVFWSVRKKLEGDGKTSARLERRYVTCTSSKALEGALSMRVVYGKPGFCELDSRLCLDVIAYPGKCLQFDGSDL